MDSGAALLVLCLLAVSAVAQIAVSGASEARQVLANATWVVKVDTVQKLRAAIAGGATQVEVLNDLTITRSNWPEDQVLTVPSGRTVTVAGPPGQIERWPLVDLFAGAKRIQLMANSTVIFQRLWLYRARPTGLSSGFPGKGAYYAKRCLRPGVSYLLDQTVWCNIVNGPSSATRLCEYGGRLTMWTVVHIWPGFDIFLMVHPPTATVLIKGAVLLADTGLPYAAHITPASIEAYQKLKPKGVEAANDLSSFTELFTPTCRQASACYPSYCWQGNLTYGVNRAALEAREQEFDGTSYTPSGYNMLFQNITFISNYPITLSCIASLGRSDGHLGNVCMPNEFEKCRCVCPDSFLS